jgi:glycosyltransferase involved in cell wall biosynthesis
MKKVSVILSAYNCEDHIEEAIRSILDQTYHNLELIIADDGSMDSTKTKIDSINDDRIKRFHNERNIGLLRTWNKLIPLTTGDYVTWQDGDDRSYNTRIEKLVAAMEADPSLALCGSNFCRPFLAWKSITTSNYPTSTSEIMRLIEGRIEVPFPGTRSMVRRDILLKFAPFREFFINNGWEDFDLFCQISEHHKVGNIPDVLYEYRYYPQSASKTKLDQITSRKVFIEDIGFFLADQRKANNGFDGLMPGGDSVGLIEFLKKIESRLQSDPRLPISRIVKNKISNKDFWAALKLIPKAIAVKPSILSSWFLLFLWGKSFIRSCINYIFQFITGNFQREYRSYHHHLQPPQRSSPLSKSILSVPTGT